MAPHHPTFLTQTFAVDEAAMAQFEQLLNSTYDYAIKRGDLVKGRITHVDTHVITVDIGAKTTAVLPVKEVIYHKDDGGNADKLEVGKTYEFYVLRDEDDEGRFTLSQRRVAQAHMWNTLKQLMADDGQIECEVMSQVKGGLLVDVKGLRGFVPSSHLKMRSNIEELIGQTLPFKILTIDQNRNNIILSHRKVMADQVAEQKRDVFGTLVIGSTIEGDVVRLTDFGAFVDLGGVDGLLPLSQMSWRWVEHPSDVLSIGDKVKVEIIGVDLDRQRVSLSIKSLQSDPWEAVASAMKQGDQVDGKVTRIKQFGAFVEIFPGVEALLSSKELQDYEAEHGEPIVPHQTISVFIQKFNPEERRISLGFRQYHGGGGNANY
jgi:ribosomal protein S1